MLTISRKADAIHEKDIAHHYLDQRERTATESAEYFRAMS
jgi:hypothetical protein